MPQRIKGVHACGAARRGAGARSGAGWGSGACLAGEPVGRVPLREQLVLELSDLLAELSHLRQRCMAWAGASPFCPGADAGGARPVLVQTWEAYRGLIARERGVLAACRLELLPQLV